MLKIGYNTYTITGRNMNSLLLLISLTCPKPIVYNNTKIWNKMDRKSLASAKKRCKVHYPKSPCLKQFFKVEYNTYRALCGK